MTDHGKKNLLGVLVDAVDYDAAVERILWAAAEKRPFSATALAVHGVMTGVEDRTHRHRLNRLDLVTPDGQPVRWALNWMYASLLPDRVYGPELMLRLCARAASEGLGIYLYGSRPDTVKALAQQLRTRFPGLRIAGSEPSVFRPIDADECLALAARIAQSGASLVFVGLGCPRQEIFVYEFRELLAIPLIAVGAAFDYHSGVTAEPPFWIQRAGLQWAYRLAQEPRRLWRRYLIANSRFVWRLFLQLVRLSRPDPADTSPPPPEFTPA